MAQNMAKDEDKNLGKFGVVRGGKYGKPGAIARREMQAQVYRLRASKALRGRTVPRALDSVAEGQTNPAGEPMKLSVRLKLVGCSLPENYRAVILPQVRELYALYGQDYDEPNAA